MKCGVEQAVDFVLKELGPEIRMAIPLGAGKPVQFVNALYNRVKNNSKFSLQIYTALTLNKPKAQSDLEKRFLDPFIDRLFPGYPDLQYEIDRQKKSVPKNISIIEFYFKAGSMLHNNSAQQNYVSSNYTHVARDVFDAEVNLIAQLMTPHKTEDNYSLGCNADISTDLVHELRRLKRKHLVLGQVNRMMPYVYGESVLTADYSDLIIDDPILDFPLFNIPKMSVSLSDHFIGLHASTLVKDGGELQIGIGSLADTLTYWLLKRHNHNDEYNKVISSLGIKDKNQQIIEHIGGLTPFKLGLLASTEMMVDGFRHLIEAKIIKRTVFDHVILQRLLNEKLIDDTVTPEMVYLLIERNAIQSQLTHSDFNFLQTYGIFKSELSYQDGMITLDDGSKVSADFNDEQDHQKIIQSCLGESLKNGAFVYAGFFIGEQKFYSWLKNLDDDVLRKIKMKSVQKINQLYGHEELDRLHRVDARFINTCMMMTLSGAAVSDGLEDGRVVSGVGGQYNFVAMAQELPDGRSILQLRSTRTHNGKKQSNIVFNYGHITIPRHLRDIVITEYGIAYLRGKTDSQVAIELIKVADSEFQQELLAQAKVSGKVDMNYKLPAQYCNNLAINLENLIQKKSLDELFLKLPLGCDFTPEELVLGKALKSLKVASEKKSTLITLLIRGVFIKATIDDMPYLKRMRLDNPQSLKERIYKKLLLAALRK